jgi:phosphoserine phosphatase
MASARALVSELAARGIFLAIRVCATRLEVVDGQWTGRILGEAMFGKAKARMAKKIAVELKLDLAHCYAYCDRSDDRWLLATVGRPVAVNATDELARLAGMHGWPVLNWKREANLTPRPGAQGALAEKKELSLVIA